MVPPQHGRMKVVWGKWSSLLFLFLLFSSHLAAAGGSINEHITVLSSSDAPGTITKTRVASCLRELMRQWDLRENDVPDLVVYHVSKKAAAAAHVKGEVAARKNSSKWGQSEYFFEIWVVGEPKLDKYIIALENVLENHFGFQVTEQKRKEVIARVFRMQDAIVEVQGK